VGCGGGGAGNGALSYVGGGQGEYIQETTYKYVGCGGDFDVVRPRRDFTCLITTCCLLSLLFLIPLLCWLLSGLTSSTSLPYDCEEGFANFEVLWSGDQQEFCCNSVGRGCLTTQPSTVFPTSNPTVPPTPFNTMPATMPPAPLPTSPPATTPPPRGDPFNCAIGTEDSWAEPKNIWCCRVHYKGCPSTVPPMPILPPVVQPIVPPPMPILPPVVQPIVPPRPADPYNCADGYANWQAGWSVGKKGWCCRVHGKGCPGTGGGCATTSPPFDCEAGFANWMAGWSVAKKAWCCKSVGKGCPPAAGGCA